jgi:hypothetical protein
VPFLAPHWALNGDDVSVALSFNYDLRSKQGPALRHKVNARLRRLGLHPDIRTLGSLRRLAATGYGTLVTLYNRLKDFWHRHTDGAGWTPG